MLPCNSPLPEFKGWLNSRHYPRVKDTALYVWRTFGVSVPPSRGWLYGFQTMPPYEIIKGRHHIVKIDVRTLSACSNYIHELILGSRIMSWLTRSPILDRNMPIMCNSSRPMYGIMNAVVFLSPECIYEAVFLTCNYQQVLRLPQKFCASFLHVQVTVW